MDTPEGHAATTEDIATAEVAGATGTPQPQSEDRHIESSPAERQSHEAIFQHSTFVHVGPGANACGDVDEESFVSNCGNPLHFHSWIHTPNQFQHNSIRTKAQAAKARKLRALRDPNSDSATVLDGELDEARHHGATELLVEEIVQKEYVKDYWKAMREVQEDEQFEHYEDDRDRFLALESKSPEDRDEEEFERLSDHLAAYADKVKETIEFIQKPLRESLSDKTIDQLIEIVREDRIQAEAQQEFEDTYSLWEWYIGCLKLRNKPAPGHPNERVFGDIEQVKAAPPEVITALSMAFTELDAEAGRALGNS